MARSRSTGEGPGNLKPYVAYKDSGVEWLGKIPAHWDLRRLKIVASVELSNVDKKSEEGQVAVMLCNYTHVYNNDRITADLDFMPATATAEQVKRFSLRCGDVLITKDSESWTDIAVAALVAAPDLRGVLCGYHLALVRPLRADLGPFLARAFATIGLRDQFAISATGVTRFGLSGEAVRTGLFPIPPVEEQRAIAMFLDRESSKIDALVAKKERLIELLGQRRTALITRAVTKGLDPSAAMKHSGVPWLGDVPAHWAVAPVYARYEVQLGKMLDEKRVTGEGSGRYLRNVNVQWDRVSTDDLPQMDFSAGEWERYLLRPGDLLVCEGGEVGRTAIWRGELPECFYQKALHRVRPRSEQEIPRHFYYVMYSLARRGVFAAGSNPNTIDHLTAVQLKRYRFPFPPPLEQRAIAEFLDRQTATLDALVANVCGAVDRLREFRVALISAAVTGKIDVRGQAVR